MEAYVIGNDNLRSYSCRRWNGIFQSIPASIVEMSRRTEPYVCFSPCGCSYSWNGREWGLEGRIADIQGGGGGDDARYWDFSQILMFLCHSIPPPPHFTPYPTENPSLSSPVCVLEIFHILLLLGSEEHKCNSLAHITGSFRPVFCCQMWPQGKHSNYLIIWRIMAGL